MATIERTEGKITWRVDELGNVTFQHKDCGGINNALRGEPGFYISSDQMHEKVNEMRAAWEKASAAEKANEGPKTKDDIVRGIDDGTTDIDPGIAPFVKILRENGVETCQSCQGGPGHSYEYPSVDFVGGPGAGMHALGICFDYALPVMSLMRVWNVNVHQVDEVIWRLEFREASRQSPAEPVEKAGRVLIADRNGNNHDPLEIAELLDGIGDSSGAAVGEQLHDAADVVRALAAYRARGRE